MIVVLQLLITVGLAIMRFRWGLVAFVFFLAFAPRSIGLQFGGGGAVFTFPRLAFPLIVVVFIASRLMQRGNNQRGGNNYWAEPIFKIMVVFSALELLSSLVNGVSPVYAIDSILATTVAFAIFYSVSSPRMVDSLFSAYLLAAIISFAIVLIEFPLETPLHYSIVNQAFYEEAGLRIRERGGFYRAQGIFDNPLVLSEFIVYMLPVAAYKMVIAQKQLRYKFLFIALFMVILATGSRAGILAYAASGITFWMSYNWFKMSKYSRILLSVVLFFLFIFSMVWGFGLVLALGEEAQTATLYLLDKAERSSLVRAVQYLDVYTTMTEHPFFGFGVLRNFDDQLEQINRLDNYILRTGLASGFPGMVVFLVFLFKVFRRGHAIYKSSTKPKERALRAFVVSLLVGFTILKLFISIPQNNIIFFSLLGIALGLYAMQRKDENERSSDTD